MPHAINEHVLTRKKPCIKQGIRVRASFALGFQHFPRDLANVNEWKIMFDPSILISLALSTSYSGHNVFTRSWRVWGGSRRSFRDTPVPGSLVSQYHLTAYRISPMDWVFIRCGYISQCTLFNLLTVLLLKHF